MNKKEWDLLQEREKDSLVAEIVMQFIPPKGGVEPGQYIPIYDDNSDLTIRLKDGLSAMSKTEFFERVSWRDRGGNFCDVPHYTTDRNECALVLDEIKKIGIQQDHGRLVSQQVGGQSFAVAIVCGNITIGDMWRMIWDLMNSDADTICYCAVKAVENANE